MQGIVEEGDKYKDCRCLVTQNPPPYVASQHGFENIKGPVSKLPNNGEGGDDPKPTGPLVCKGMDEGKWVSRDAAMSAAEGDFCKDAGRLKSENNSDDDLQNGRINSDAWYNHDQKDDMHLKITWYQNGEITYDNCVGFFRSIIDECDKDDPKNPGNVKHGGVWTHQPEGSSSKVAVLELNPSGGKYRNDCTGLDSEHWLADYALAGAIEDFCPKAVRKVHSPVAPWITDTFCSLILKPKDSSGRTMTDTRTRSPLWQTGRKTREMNILATKP